MIKKVFAQLILALGMIGCASAPTQPVSDYHNDLVVPQATENFTLANKHVFDEPMAGVSLSYQNRAYPTDVITLYVYPIDALSWDDAAAVLAAEMEDVMADVDIAVERGHYLSRTEPVVDPFSFESDGHQFSGLKSSFDVVAQNGVTYHSNSYLFLQQDKYIKFRTSFDSRVTVAWSGDETVKEILPGVSVPPESPYMAQLRATHREQLTQAMIQAILAAAAKQKAGKANTATPDAAQSE